ncbi:AmpG family muropeptide MFS transporter [Leminorella grimontii]|uniref:Anhydromuropeptide permease n=1 Tax=Leminorella grimontii TaxID=82981 RepID=A0AAV5MZ15_9GAMM|nr:muropeptide MFS transporter AmpG [Leminorella grimontii]KFC95402.1 AmpG family permease [Leminorella grimontii ATCC 33999 = DSM 5078]GKX54029.1 AmpG family muropeptide MFS transporter [Leminorella grimontii]VFS60246.1 muropeptide transporter [Leminorella grimontii]
MTNSYFKAFTERNAAVLLLLGFSSGLPLALTSGTLQAWITVAGMDVTTIGFFSLVGQAYVFKFLWSPLMDRYRLPFLGRRRGWMLLTQIALVVLILALGCLTPQNDLWLMAALAVLIAFFSASQDIAFDAYKTDVLSAEQRGNGAAISVLGYRLAMLVSGGLALWIADYYIGWQSTYWLMAALMVIGIIATLWAKEPDTTPSPKTLKLAVVEPLKDFFGRNNAWLILLLIILYKLGDAFAGSLSTTFLIRGVGFLPGEVGLVNKTLGLLATIIGVLIGGILMQRLTLFRALMLFGILQAVSNFGYWILAVTDKSLITMGSAIFFENLCGGMGTAAFVALLMTLCNRSFSATQFALLSALSAVGRVYVGPVAGWFVERYDWPLFYLFTVIVALPGLALLIFARQTLAYTQETGGFLPRTRFAGYYQKAIRLVVAGVTLLGIWLALLFWSADAHSGFYYLKSGLLVVGSLLTLLGIALGCILDYRAIREPVEK